MPATTYNPLSFAVHVSWSRLCQPFRVIFRSSCPRMERILIGSAGLRIVARRVPSGERSTDHRLSFGVIANRVSSEPRPFRGSREVIIACLRSSLGSAIAHRVEGDLAH